VSALGFDGFDFECRASFLLVSSPQATRAIAGTVSASKATHIASDGVLSIPLKSIGPSRSVVIADPSLSPDSL
jgi:hypothetical protein